MSFPSDRLLIISSIPVFTQSLVWAAGLCDRRCWVMTDGPPDATWRRMPHVLGVRRMSREMLVSASTSLVDGVNALCMEEQIGIIVAADTRGTRLLHRIEPQLSASVRCFPMCRQQVFEQLYDKARFAALLEDLGLPGPKTRLIRNEDELQKLDLGAPIMLKPTQGEGGRGIVKLSDRQRLLEVAAERLEGDGNTLLLQQFVPGRDVDISLLAHDGRCVAWTQQERRAPGRMRFLADDRALKLAQHLVKATGYHGVMHLDMRLDAKSDELLFIEANPRFWGSLCYSVWNGVNFLDLGIRMMDGEDVTSIFDETTGDCPYLAPTRSSIGRDLLGGWPPPRRLTTAQAKAWWFHHRLGSGAIWSALEACWGGR